MGRDEDAALERQFLDFVFQTDVPITPGALAYYAGCSIDRAQELIDKLTARGTIRLESDDQGELFWVYPNRKVMPKRDALATRSPQALASPAPPPSTTALSAGPPVMNIGGPPVPAPASSSMPMPIVRDDGQHACPFCAETIQPTAKKCKHCGELLDPVLRAKHAERSQPVQVNVGVQHYQTPPAQVAPYGKQLNPGTAAVLSFVWPGAGQMYAGKVGQGLLWMLAVGIGYVALIVPGLILHGLCIFSATRAARDTNAGR